MDSKTVKIDFCAGNAESFIIYTTLRYILQGDLFLFKKFQHQCLVGKFSQTKNPLKLQEPKNQLNNLYLNLEKSEAIIYVQYQSYLIQGT